MNMGFAIGFMNPKTREYIELDPAYGSLTLELVNLHYNTGIFDVIEEIETKHVNNVDHGEFFQDDSPFKARNLTEIEGLKVPKYPD